MNYKRFGRLNTKKLNEYLEEFKKDKYIQLLDMARLFPRLATRKVTEDNRFIINSFNTLIKKYKYCYKLYSNCIAEIQIKGQSGYFECSKIDNNVYVFTNLQDIDDSDCELIFNRDEKILIKQMKNDDFRNIDIVGDILNQMKKRRIKKKEIEALEDLLNYVKFLPIKYEDISENMKKNLSNSVFVEFRWRILLYNTEIYQKDESFDNIKIKKVKVEDGYTILNHINRYSFFDELVNDMEEFQYQFLKFNEYEYFNHSISINKLATDIRENRQLEYWFNVLNNEDSLNSILQDKIDNYEHFLEVYSFLQDYHSKQYRHLFDKHNKYLTQWQTQQIFRKYKKEYEVAIINLEQLYLEFDNLKIYEDKLNKVNRNIKMI